MTLLKSLHHKALEAEQRSQRQELADDAVRQRRRQSDPSTVQSEGRARVRLVERKCGDNVVIIDDDVVKYAEADDGLPTAKMTVDGVCKSVKLDNVARYSVAGTE
ncbi:hypothetical protein L915_11453 [Phytophthora nicotianae]|uniref:Uncharacterized protein n=1 Tax=Phytophthora nicotianae TaxID=4792 RepID=W2GM15_PHYNI|nr:hypothetical protein L915_11453 [Phytophthora nicotianae]